MAVAYMDTAERKADGAGAGGGEVQIWDPSLKDLTTEMHEFMYGSPLPSIVFSGAGGAIDEIAYERAWAAHRAAQFMKTRGVT